jgi:hypothetical protein
LTSVGGRRTLVVRPAEKPRPNDVRSTPCRAAPSGDARLRRSEDDS